MDPPGEEPPEQEESEGVWRIELPSVIDEPFPRRVERPYDPAKELWKTRGLLARRLLYLLAITILLPLGLVAFGRIGSDELKTVLEPILPPLFALVGTALGFYFGGSGRPHQ
jgi:hypothetical protein